MALKSAYEAALEKMKSMDIDDAQSLTGEQKDHIGDYNKSVYRMNVHLSVLSIPLTNKLLGRFAVNTEAYIFIGFLRTI